MPALQTTDYKDEHDAVIYDPRDANTPDKWIKRHPELIRLTGKHPFNCEPPAPLLVSKGFITPVPIHYVRNHGAVPQLSWQDHRVSVVGLVKSEVTLTMDLLEQLPSITLPVTLVCAGNRRKEQNMHKQSIGFHWGTGGISTALWKGVLVRDLLLHLAGGLQDSAKFICFDGVDKLPNGTYGTSLSVERVMNPMNDIILAYEMNGERLTPDHGFPVRLIVPGVIGGRMVKYLSTITVSDDRSDSWYHYHDNRVLPSMVTDADMAKREKWWFRPEYTINELNINSAICSPAHGSVLPISDPDALTKEITISGYAYNGGCKKIVRVEVTLDSGKTWVVSDLDHPEELPQYRCKSDPFPRQRYWCWCFWSVKVPVRELLHCKDIQVRAWDSTMNTQPKDLNWNLMGMMNNCWYRVKIELGVDGLNESELVLRFIHPTVPGPENGGGWMTPSNGGGQATDKAIVPATKPAPILTTALTKVADTSNGKIQEITPTTSNGTPSSVKNTVPPAGVACFTAEMVAEHSTPEDCWIIHNDKVYDCTPFLKEHPGGADSITMNAGEDCTEDFDAIHSANAREMLVKYYIGELVTELPPVVVAESKETTTEKSTTSLVKSVPPPTTSSGLLTPDSSTVSSPVMTMQPFINPKKWQDIVLLEKLELTHNTRRFRFGFGEPNRPLGLPLGNHLLLKIKTEDGSPCIRAYTPTSAPEQPGYLDLVIKVYFKDQDPRFPAGGVVSQYLDSLPIGANVAIKGPIGHFTYNGQGEYTGGSSTKRTGKCRQIGMICGGTGLTPMYQIMQAILADKEQDSTKVSLMFGNRTEDDILMRDAIDSTGAELGSDRFHLWHVLSNETPEGWKYGSGFMNKEMIKEHLFPGMVEDEDMGDKIVLLCGPPPMINFCCIPALTELYGKDFVDNNVFCF
ncbi:hypothetical protein BG004_003845 [Podila humilis]|nr:hypothetical protein BG004_003845 [Podila humilis]